MLSAKATVDAAERMGGKNRGGKPREEAGMMVASPRVG